MLYSYSNVIKPNSTATVHVYAKSAKVCKTRLRVGAARLSDHDGVESPLLRFDMQNVSSRSTIICHTRTGCPTLRIGSASAYHSSARVSMRAYLWQLWAIVDRPTVTSTLAAGAGNGPMEDIEGSAADSAAPVSRDVP
jgi:hypothetical protein